MSFKSIGNFLRGTTQQVKNLSEAEGALHKAKSAAEQFKKNKLKADRTTRGARYRKMNPSVWRKPKTSLSSHKDEFRKGKSEVDKFYNVDKASKNQMNANLNAAESNYNKAKSDLREAQEKGDKKLLLSGGLLGAGLLGGAALINRNKSPEPQPAPQSFPQAPIKRKRRRRKSMKKTAGVDINSLKKNAKPLSDEERAEVKKRGATWSDGSVGIRKAEVNGKTVYFANTHRMYQTAPTLAGILAKWPAVKASA